MKDINKDDFKDEDSFTIYFITNEIYQDEEDFKILFKYLNNYLKERYDSSFSGFYLPVTDPPICIPAFARCA